MQCSRRTRAIARTVLSWASGSTVPECTLALMARVIAFAQRMRNVPVALEHATKLVRAQVTGVPVTGAARRCTAGRHPMRAHGPALDVARPTRRWVMCRHADRHIGHVALSVPIAVRNTSLGPVAVAVIR